MTMVRTGMTTALRALEQAIEAPRKDGTASESVSLGNWRWTVRQRMAAVRDVLSGEVGDPEDGWLAARGGRAFRERNTLLGRMSALGPQVLENPDVERVRPSCGDWSPTSPGTCSGSTTSSTTTSRSSWAAPSRPRHGSRHH